MKNSDWETDFAGMDVTERKKSQDVSNMFIQEKIIKQALAILGATQSIQNAGVKLDNAERICDVFVQSAIEEVFLAITWKDAVELIPQKDGKIDAFTNVGVSDCIKVITIAPSNIEWYVDKKKIYFKGSSLDSGFYYSNKILKELQNNTDVDIPNIFITLCSLYLASNASHALYSDSIFTDGMKKQYLQKIEEAKKLHFFDYHLINSARFT